MLGKGRERERLCLLSLILHTGNQVVGIPGTFSSFLLPGGCKD